MKTKLTLFTLTALICAGCNQGDTPETVQPPPTTDVAEAPPPEQPEVPPQPDVTVTIKSWDETQQLVAQQRGKVVVLDLWSTWCVPCVREFPNLVKLHRAHPDEVVCMSFNLDYSGVPDEPAESFQESVQAFLSKHGATFTNVISSDPADEVFNRLDLGSIPAVMVYDRDGQLAKRFDNDDAAYGDEGFTYDDHIIPFVGQLLTKKASPSAQPQPE
jgi:thiol-disulfide isomerase/thioredoxin